MSFTDSPDSSICVSCSHDPPGDSRIGFHVVRIPGSLAPLGLRRLSSPELAGEFRIEKSCVLLGSL